jgi:hypothetical protein
MSAFGSADAISKTIVVRCSVDTAFRTWTEQINAWWPKGHSRSGNPSTTIFLERHVGGRIYERTPEGVEHAWGEVMSGIHHATSPITGSLGVAPNDRPAWMCILSPTAMGVRASMFVTRVPN